MDRVQLMIRKKHLTYKEGAFGKAAYQDQEEEEPAFVVRKHLNHKKSKCRSDLLAT
jgi:hypothetical protein